MKLKQEELKTNFQVTIDLLHPFLEICVEYSSYDVLFLLCIYPFYIAVLTRYPNKKFWNFLQLCLGLSMDNRGLHGKFFFSNRFQYMHFVI